MPTQLITADYGNAFTVSFTTEAWFNATAVAKHFGKLPAQWLRLDSTKEYIACLQEFHLCENHTNKQNQFVMTKTGQPQNGGGTWFHPKLAVAFARWLDARFAVWCDLQIEKILHSNTEFAMFSEFIKPITDPIDMRDFEWRKQVICQVIENLKKAQVSSTTTISGEELLAGKGFEK